MTADRGRVGLVIHGGVEVQRNRSNGRELNYMRLLIRAGRDRLNAGARALDVVVETLQAMEASGLYPAGAGAWPDNEGRYELDGALADGAGERAGGVWALSGFKSPILAARVVLDARPNYLLYRKRADELAREAGLETIDTPAVWYAGGARAADPTPGSIGCIALDARGALAAGSSTTGQLTKMLPLDSGELQVPAAMLHADDQIAVACACYGVGGAERFLRASATARIARRFRESDDSLEIIAANALAQAGVMGGVGGLIAMSARGDIVMPYLSAGMRRAALYPNGRMVAAVFQEHA